MRGQSAPSGARYCSSVTFSIQVTGDPLTDSWMAMWVMPSCGVAPCQCLCSAGHQRMSPAWNSSFGPPSTLGPADTFGHNQRLAGGMRVPGCSRARFEMDDRSAHARWLWPLKLARNGRLACEVLGWSVDRLHVGLACNIHSRTPMSGGGGDGGDHCPEERRDDRQVPNADVRLRANRPRPHRLRVKKAVILSNGITSVRSYRSV